MPTDENEQDDDDGGTTGGRSAAPREPFYKRWWKWLKARFSR